MFFGHYKLVLVPIGLTNAQMIFMMLMGIVFQKYLDS